MGEDVVCGFTTQGMAIFKWGAGRHGLTVFGKAVMPGNACGIPGPAISMMPPFEQGDRPVPHLRCATGPTAGLGSTEWRLLGC